MSENAKFCNECGAVANPNAAVVQAPQQTPVPPIQPSIKKKKHTGRWVTLAILLLIVCGVLWFVGTITGNILGIIPIKPKDLGVRYTAADYASAIQKTGIAVTYNGKTGQDLEQYKKTLGNKSLNINDYNWQFTDFQPKSFTLTPAEATALLNEVAPGVFWFKNIQVNVLPDGTMAGSSTVNVAKLKKELLSDVASQIPIPLPDSVNIYSKGNLSIHSNVLTASPQEATIGSIGLPKQYMTPQTAATASPYLQRIYTVIPGLQINDLKANANGTIQFDGVIPQKVTVTDKTTKS